MGLREQLMTDLSAALRSKDTQRVSTIRLLRAAIQNAEIARTDPKNSQHGKPVTEGDLLSLVEREVKQRQESIDAFTKGHRPDLVAKEQAEMDILTAYLPTRMSREDIVEFVTSLTSELGTEFKTIMPRAARELKGRADGRLVNEIVRELTI